MSTNPDTRYTLLERILGPKVTDDEIIELELRAAREGWYEVLEALLTTRKTQRARRFLLAYLRDGLITVEVHVFEFQAREEDVYEDPDPYEGFGQR